MEVEFEVVAVEVIDSSLSEVVEVRVVEVEVVLVEVIDSSISFLTSVLVPSNDLGEFLVSS